MKWLENKELQEVLSYWLSNSIPQKLSSQFAELLSQTRSEPNKINAPPNLFQPLLACFTGKQCILLSQVSEVHWSRKTRVVCISFSHTPTSACLPFTFSSYKVTSTLLLDYNVPLRLEYWGVTRVCSTFSPLLPACLSRSLITGSKPLVKLGLLK